ncbi:MAG: succinylglutamate desuccinylase/aspartoacylase family protein [Verrucomicrobiales bacterium]
MRRWKSVASAARLRWHRLGSVGDDEVLALQTPNQDASPVWDAYFSAGVHGDEPAGTEALLEWASHNTEWLATHRVLIIPCWNPWGMRENSRRLPDGQDLNRMFNRKRSPLIRAWYRIMGRRSFAMAYTFHEDYDATGLYVYEVATGRKTFGPQVVEAGSHLIPIDSRKQIDGNRVRAAGWICRKIRPERFETMGLPEAVCLYLDFNVPSVFTFETPSECDLDLRIQAQVAMLNSALRLQGF